MGEGPAWWDLNPSIPYFSFRDIVDVGPLGMRGTRGQEVRGQEVRAQALQSC